MRHPDWGNKWITRFGTVQQRNLNDDLKIFQRLSVTIEDGFEIRMSANTQYDAQAFMASYLNNIGKTVDYVDFEGTKWHGYWIPASCELKRGMPGCNFQVSASFRGVITDATATINS